MTKKVIQSEKLTVLFASGDEYLKERVLEVLDKDRHHVIVADNCKDALEKLLDSDFDAIIFDHDLKELDSTDTMQLIKKIRPKLPLIVLSKLFHMNRKWRLQSSVSILDWINLWMRR